MSKQKELVDRLMENFSIHNVDTGDFATHEELMRHIGYVYPHVPHAPDCPKTSKADDECDCGADKPYSGPTYG